MDNSHVLSMLYPEIQQRCDHPDSTRPTHNRCERRPHPPLRHCVPEVASKYASFSITSSVQLIASIGHISSSVQCCSRRTNGTKAGRSPSCDRDISSISHLSASSQHAGIQIIEAVSRSLDAPGAWLIVHTHMNVAIACGTKPPSSRVRDKMPACVHDSMDLLYAKLPLSYVGSEDRGSSNIHLL